MLKGGSASKTDEQRMNKPNERTDGRSVRQPDEQQSDGAKVIRDKIDNLNATIAKLEAVKDDDAAPLLQKKKDERDRLNEQLQQHKPLKTRIAAATRSREAAMKAHAAAEVEIGQLQLIL